MGKIKVESCEIEGLKVITPTVFGDERGYFMETYNYNDFKEAGIDEQEFLAKIDMLADRAFEDQCTTANPRVPLVSEIKEILLDSYYGKEIK